jgi:hypothetical protein
MEELSTEEKLKLYPKTDMFRIKETIGTPHPIMIGSDLVAFAADNYGGMLGTPAMKAYEAAGKRVCVMGHGHNKCNLSLAEHEQALLIEVDSKLELNEVEGLNDYLMECKPLAEEHNFAGFAFIRGEGYE